MDFSKDTVHEDIRQAVRDLCAKFPDEYWMKHDQSQEFPWEFYNAIVEAVGYAFNFVQARTALRARS